MEIVRQQARDESMSAARAQSIIRSLTSKEHISLIVEICSKCNLTCCFCDLHSGKLQNAEEQKGIMEQALYSKLLDDISALGYKLKVLHFHGMGEPLLQKNLPEMIRSATERNLAESYVLITNGTAMSPEVFDRLLTSGLSEIRVSLDTVDREHYKTIKGKDLLPTVLKNIDYAIATLTPKHNLRMLVKVPGSESEGTFNIAENNTEQIIARFSGVKNDNVKLIVQPLANFTEEETCNYLPCEQVFYSIIVKYDGRVSPCCIDIFDNLNIGNIRNKALGEILASGELREIRMQHIDGRVAELPQCVHCGFRSAVDLTGFAEEIKKVL